VSRDVVSKSIKMQALQKYKDTAIAESERIEEQFDDLIKDFDLDSSFVFHIGLDIQPTHSWKAPYKDIKVNATPPSCLLHQGTLKTRCNQSLTLLHHAHYARHKEIRLCATCDRASCSDHFFRGLFHIRSMIEVHICVHSHIFTKTKAPKFRGKFPEQLEP
jgi:hypothetical protein